MNIDDFKAPETPSTWDEILHAVFDRQEELMKKYKEIEQLPDPPVPLHHPTGQRILRDFAWRATEELTESYEAFEEYAATADDQHVHHMVEELADSLHFLVELLIFAGITADQCLVVTERMTPMGGRLIDLYNRPINDAYWEATYELGLAMNFLRNKAWKKHHVPTDEERFRAQLLMAFYAHFNIWRTLGLTIEDLFSYYFKKSEVNKFRQRSGY